ncbi:MAG: hypothetical protein PHI59_02970, partial [Candidatus Omnitrophica bacterium]|nr:hypothetical protein [Candidatus Omnitrophota bacterium]
SDNIVGIKQVSPDVQILYSQDGKSGMAPLVAVRQLGQGRVGYLSACGNNNDFFQLAKRMIFWCAKKESAITQLNTDTPDTFIYLYPKIKTVLLYNMNPEQRKVQVSVDPSLLGIQRNEDCVLRDGITGEVLGSVSAAQLTEGFSLDLLPWTFRLVEVNKKGGAEK